MSIEFEDGIIKTPNIEFDENCGGIGYYSFMCFKKYKERVAMIIPETDELLTYSDFLQRCTRTALMLQKQGFKKNDLLAICSNKENLDANVPIIAGQFLGMITFSLDPSLSINECAELTEQVQPKIIFVLEEAKDMITKSLAINNVTTKMVIFGEPFEDEYLKYQDDEHNFKPVHIDNLHDTCMIHFSSGSTGHPKPICLNHYYFMKFVYQQKLTAVRSLPLKSSQENNRPALGDDSVSLIPRRQERNKEFAKKPLGFVALGFANWYWVSASYELMVYIQIGGCRILWDKFNAEKLWNYIERFFISNIILTPQHCIELASSSRPDEVDVSNLVTIATGGYVLHKEYIQILRKLFPGTHIHQLYGMTESGLPATFNTYIPEHVKLLTERPESCGLPVPGLYYKIINLETGKKCGPNQPGELYLKGKIMFNGFYNQDASDSFDHEGYFRTGDLLYFDEDFCFYIMDRIKAVIGWKDFLIYPSHIEKVLMDHPSVLEAVVIGIPHKIESERLMGVVILKKDAPEVIEDELVKYVEERVEDHKRLREGVKFVKQFPLTVTGKINRLNLKKMILNDLKIE